MEQTTIGKRIMTLRKSRGWTQEQLAEKLGVSGQAVSKWENDVSCPDISLLPKLSEVFQVTTDSLLGVPEKTESEAWPQMENGEQEADGFSFVLDSESGRAEVRFGSLPGFATALLLFAVAMLLNRTVLAPLGHASVWALLWPSVVLACGLSSLWERISVWTVCLTGLGAYCLLNNMGILPWRLQPRWNLILMVVLLLWAVSMLLKHFRHGRRAGGAGSCRTRDGAISCDACFCARDLTVTEEALRGGSVDVAFSSCTLDLRNCAQSDPDCVLKADVAFGSLKVLLPKDWSVQDETERVFSSVKFHGQPSPDASQVLVMKNDVVFGSLDLCWED